MKGGNGAALFSLNQSILFNMRKLMLFIAVASVFVGCKKDEGVKTGTVEVTISYFYNDFQGYKPDVDASIYLFKQTGKSYERSLVDYRIGVLTVEGTEETVRHDFKATANVNGVATINNVPYGEYLLVAASEGRWSYSVKPIKLNAPKLEEVKNFGYLREFDNNGESW